MNKLKAIWKIEELRGKILVTLLLLLAFRLGCCLPVPFVSNTALDAMFSNNSIFGYMNMLSGGALSRSAFFALGVSPYINASIITQLLCVALPSWEALQKETTGKDKLDEYTKRIALAMAVVMSVGYYFVLRNYGALKYTAGKSGIFAAIVIIATFLAGSQISVWLGGRIDEYGIGNGVSLLIFAGIVSRWSDINSIVTNVIGKVKAGEWLYSLIGILTAVAMLAAVWFVTYSDGAERRVPVQYAARTQRVRPAASYIPIKLLMSGVMPIIFAGVIMSLPATLDMFIDATKHQRLHAVLSVFTTESWLYCLLYVLLIAAFNFFYIEIQFDAVSMAGSLRKQGGTIPGIRPGTPTTDMLNKALHRMALTGSFYLAAIALTPMVFSAMSGVRISFGGTSLMFSLIDDGHIKVDEKGNIKADEDSGLATIELINLYNMMVPVYLSFRNLSEAYKEEIQSSLSDSLFGNTKNSDSEKLMKKIEELEKMLDKAKADAARAIEAENAAEQKLIQSKKRENALTSKLETAYKEIDELMERIPEPEEAEVVCEAEEERQEPVQQVQAKDYAAALDALLKQHTVVIVGGNENLMKKFQVAHPDASLVAKDMLGTCDQQIQNADIVMFKVDSCSHALYNKGKTICNRYDVPFCYIPNVASIPRIEQSMCEQLEEIFS